MKVLATFVVCLWLIAFSLVARDAEHTARGPIVWACVLSSFALGVWVVVE